MRVLTTAIRPTSNEFKRNVAHYEGLVADLKKKYGSQIAPEFSVNPELLGGMKIRVGSDVWDGSVKNRLERLGEQFN